MKRILRCFIAVAVIFAAACFVPALSGLTGGIEAAAISSGNFEFYENLDGTLTISSYEGKGSPTTLTLPSSANGKTVTAISSYALDKVKSTLKTVKIPGSIKRIESYAFTNLKALESVAFISSGLESIGNEAFYNCTSLKSIGLPGTLTTIEDYAFENCSSLKSLTIPNKVTKLGKYTFENCTSLASISFPSGLKDFGLKSFDDTPWLAAQRKVYSSKLVIVNGILVDAAASPNASITLPKSLVGIADCAYNSNTKVKSVVIPEGCKSIGLAAFTFCENLESVTIPSSVTHIGGNAFDETKWLEIQQKKSPFVIVNKILINGDACKGAITIPSNVKMIGEWAFSQNYNITSVTIPSNVTAMEDQVFRECSALKTVKIANGLTKISERAFQNCTSLESINIPSTVKSIGLRAFNYCKNLKSIAIPNSVYVIDSAAFYNCEGLKSLTLPTTACRIGDWAFGYCKSLTSLTIPSKITFVDIAQFVGASGLKSLVIQEGIKKIPDEAFAGCTALESLKLPNSLTYIGYEAFAGCSKLTYITIPKNVVTIREYAFQSCTSLKSVKIHASTKTIGSYAFTNNGSSSATVICERNSAAEKFAKSNGFKVSYFEISTRRFAGNSRYSTAAKVAEKTYPSGCKTVVIASGSQYADALAGVTLANKLGAPILLSTPTGLDDTTIARIKALKATKAYILGGKGAVPDSVTAQLGKLNISIVRLSGSDRYKTAVKIANKIGSLGTQKPETIFAVCATSFPDAVSASAAAAVNGAPIIYIKPNGTIDASTANYLGSMQGTVLKIYVVGGESTVPDTALKALRKYCSVVERISGANRYTTSAAVNEKFIDMFDNSEVCVVTGKDFPDALTAGVYAAKTKSALILADQSVAAETKQFLMKKCPMLVTAIGGTGAVPKEMLSKIVAAVKAGW